MSQRGTRHLIRGVGTVLLCLVALASSGCGGGGNGTGGTPPTASSATLSGTAIKGPFKRGSVVTATEINGTGRATGTVSNDQGVYTLTVTWTGPTKIEVSGVYADELNNNQEATVPASDPISVIAEAVAGTTVTANPNLVSSIAAKLIEERRAAGALVTAATILQANRDASQAILGQQIDTLGEVDLTKAANDEQAAKVLTMQLVLASSGRDASFNSVTAHLAKNILNGHPLGAPQDGTAVSSTAIHARLAEIEAGGNLTVGSSQVSLTTILTNLGTASGAPTEFNSFKITTAANTVETALNLSGGTTSGTVGGGTGTTSDSGNPGTTTGTPGGTTTGTSASLLVAATSTGFRVVNPANPGGSPSFALSNVPNPFVVGFWQGTYNRATFVAENLRVQTAVYINQFLGQVQKVTAGTSLISSQVSNETSATVVCAVDGAEDYVNHDDSQYLYALPTPASSCRDRSNAQWKMVRLGANSVSPPIAAKRPISVLHDPATGAITGWLAQDGATLRKYEKQFLNPTTVLSDLGTSELVFKVAQSPTHLLLGRFDGGLPQTRLFAYSRALGTVGSALHTATDLGSNYVLFVNAQDNQHFYFSDGSSIYKMPLDGSAVATSLLTLPSTSSIDALRVTTTKLVYVEFGGTATQKRNILQAIPKTGGPPTILAQDPEGTGTQQFSFKLVVTAGDLVYYHRGQTIAGVVKDDGSGKTEPSGQWVGVIDAPTAALFGVNASPPARLLRHSGSQLFSVVASIGEASARLLGTVPTDLRDLTFSGFSGDIVGNAASGTSTTRDVILYANTDVANSFSRVTPLVASSPTTTNNDTQTTSSQPGSSNTLTHEQTVDRIESDLRSVGIPSPFTFVPSF